MRGQARSPWRVSYVGGEICTLVLLVYNTHWLSDVFVSKTHLTAWINVFRLLFSIIMQIFWPAPCPSPYPTHPLIWYTAYTMVVAPKINYQIWQAFCLESNSLVTMIIHVRYSLTSYHT